jgi:predicted nucleotidyltransferase component of viral defense system
MAKIAFTQAQQLDLTKRLQLLLLDCLAASGDWDCARFQGGTCLSLSYGSSRFSEDLDFLLGSDKGLNRTLAGVQTRMTNVLRVSLVGAKVQFHARGEDLQAKSAKNPRTFTMTVSHAEWHRTIKIKAEFWIAAPQSVRKYESAIVTAKLLTQPVLGTPLRMSLPLVLLPTATLKEILVDKLHALACRPYMKHRDVFDLWWLAEQGVKNWREELLTRYPYHANLYADSPTLPQLLAVLRSKMGAIAMMVGKPDFSNDLKKWLGADASLAAPKLADAIAKQVADNLAALLSEGSPIADQRAKP